MKFPVIRRYPSFFNPKYCILGFIRPEDFIEVAARLEEPNKRSIEWFKDQISRGIPIENLLLSCRNARFTGHEGRHRATVCVELGVEYAPVSLWIKDADYITYRTPEGGLDHDIIWDIDTMGDDFYYRIARHQSTCDLRLPPYIRRRPSGDRIVVRAIPEASDLCGEVEVEIIISNFDRFL